MTHFNFVFSALFAVFSLHLANAQTQVAWQKKINVLEGVDGSIVATSDDSYAASGYSVEAIPAGNNGYFEFTVNNMYGMVGISDQPNSIGYEYINFAFQLWSGASLNIIENGDTKATVGTWKKGDMLRIQKKGNVVTYYQNDVLVYTSQTPADMNAFYADFSFGGSGTGFDAPQLGIGDFPTSLEEGTKESAVVFYPNPAHDVLHISSPSEGVTEIYTVEGALVKTSKKESGIGSVELQMPVGLYQVRFIPNGTPIVTHTMVVK